MTIIQHFVFYFRVKFNSFAIFCLFLESFNEANAIQSWNCHKERFTRTCTRLHYNKTLNYGGLVALQQAHVYSVILKTQVCVCVGRTFSVSYFSLQSKSSVQNKTGSVNTLETYDYMHFVA